MRTQRVDLNIIPGSVSPTIHLTQYDKDTNSLVFNVYGEPGFYIPPNSVATITGTKPDGYGFSYSATINGDVVTATVAQQMTAVPGIVVCELRITNGNNNVGSQTFYLDIKKAALSDDTVISDSQIPAITNAQQYAANAAQSATAAQNAVNSVTGLGNGVGVPIFQETHINALVNPGLYYLNSNYVSGIPEGTNGELWVYKYSTTGSGVIQIFRRHGTNNVNDNKFYVRRINETGTDDTPWWVYVDSTQVLLRSGGDGTAMNGNLVLNNDRSTYAHTSVELETNPSANLYTGGYYLQYHSSADDGFHNMGWFRGVKYTNGRQGLQLQAQRTVNGTNVYTGFVITIDAQGNKYCSVDDPLPYRSALGLSSDAVSVTTTCSGLISNSGTRIIFYIPYNVRYGKTSVTATKLTVVVRHSDGGYAYARSGTDGNTYTSLGSAYTALINENGTYVRENEISAITYTAQHNSGIAVMIDFVYKLTKSADASDILTNNTPLSVQAQLIGTLT